MPLSTAEHAYNASCIMPVERVHATLMGGGALRILVAFEDEYRAFRDAIAEALQILHPGDEVEAAELGAIEERMAVFDPRMAVASVPNAFGPGGREA